LRGRIAPLWSWALGGRSALTLARLEIFCFGFGFLRIKTEIVYRTVWAIRDPGHADPAAMELQQMTKLYLFFRRHNLNQIGFDIFRVGVVGKPESL
jgi:hypothetical protein